MDRSVSESRPPAVGSSAWRDYQKHALRLSIGLTVEEACQRERRFFRITGVWAAAGLLSAVLVGAVWGMRLLDSIESAAIRWPLGFLGMVALVVLPMSPIGFLVSLVQWLFALRKRRKMGYPAYHPDLPQYRAAAPSSPPSMR